MKCKKGCGIILIVYIENVEVLFDKCAKNKLKNELSEEMYKNLELLHEADINSCKNIDKIK